MDNVTIVKSYFDDELDKCVEVIKYGDDYHLELSTRDGDLVDIVELDKNEVDKYLN